MGWPRVVAALALQTPLVASPAAVDPFAFFRPSIVVSSDDRRQLDRGQPVARVVPGTSGEIAVFAVVQADTDGDRLVAWARQIAELKKSPYVLAICRFSDPPRIEDLKGLTLDDEDLSAIRRCRPGECDLKLARVEMNVLRQALDEGRRLEACAPGRIPPGRLAAHSGLPREWSRGAQIFVASARFAVPDRQPAAVR